jgi:hypothetical protein
MGGYCLAFASGYSYCLKQDGHTSFTVEEPVEFAGCGLAFFMRGPHRVHGPNLVKGFLQMSLWSYRSRLAEHAVNR